MASRCHSITHPVRIQTHTHTQKTHHHTLNAMIPLSVFTPPHTTTNRTMNTSTPSAEMYDNLMCARSTSLITTTTTLTTFNSPLPSLSMQRVSKVSNVSSVFTFDQAQMCTTPSCVTPIENLIQALAPPDAGDCNHYFVTCGLNLLECNKCRVTMPLPAPERASEKRSCHYCHKKLKPDEPALIKCMNPHPPLQINRGCVVQYHYHCLQVLVQDACRFVEMKMYGGSWDTYWGKKGDNDWCCPKCLGFCDCASCKRYRNKRLLDSSDSENDSSIANTLKPNSVQPSIDTSNRITVKAKRKNRKKVVESSDDEVEALRLKSKMVENQCDELMSRSTTASVSPTSSNGSSVFVQHYKQCIAQFETPENCHLVHGYCDKYTPGCSCGAICTCCKPKPCKQHQWSDTEYVHCVKCGCNGY